MFTGIIETLGTIERVEKEGSNIHFELSSALTIELKVDQSLSHDGVCLTVTAISDHHYRVTAIDETLQKTALQLWEKGRIVNLERAMLMNARLDGHMVQGHVDTTGICETVEEKDGSWNYYFNHPKGENWVTVPKGSIAVNGVSLTVVNSNDHSFSVSIIPYTYEHTTFKQIKVGDRVNLEFDIIGKYIARLLKT
jgi:riboflavin synthase